MPSILNPIAHVNSILPDAWSLQSLNNLLAATGHACSHGVHGVVHDSAFPAGNSCMCCFTCNLHVVHVYRVACIIAHVYCTACIVSDMPSFMGNLAKFEVCCRFLNSSMKLAMAMRTTAIVVA